MAIMAEAKKGVSALQISRHIGVQYKTAWHLCHRIRKAMQEQNPPPMGSQGQIVEIDETKLGGRKLRKGNKAGVDNKILVLGIAERNGRVHMQKISSVKAATLRPILNEKLSPNAKEFVTDSQPAYGWILPTDKHTEVSHRKELLEDGEVSNKTIEGAFSLFKRGVIGSYHKLSEDHLDSYLQEFCWAVQSSRSPAAYLPDSAEGADNEEAVDIQNADAGDFLGLLRLSLLLKTQLLARERRCIQHLLEQSVELLLVDLYFVRHIFFMLGVVSLINFQCFFRYFRTLGEML